LSQEYWSSEEGVLARLEDLSWALTTKVVNNSVRAHLKDLSPIHVIEFEWVTDYKSGTPCAYCDSQSGRRYYRGQFMPIMPVHPGCNCYWDVRYIIVGEEDVKGLEDWLLDKAPWVIV
jgi:hypothetical protein